MIVGHIGFALGLRASAKSSQSGEDRRWLLPSLVAASLVPDVIDVALALAGVPNSLGLYSHSLPAIGWLAASVFILALIATRPIRLAGMLSGAVMLHLPADLITGQKILWPGATAVGLDLYRWPVADFFIEVPVMFAGWSLLRRRKTLRTLHPFAASGVGLLLAITLQAVVNVLGLVGGTLKP